MEQDGVEFVAAWRRLRDFGLRLGEERRLLMQDLQRLSEKFDRACTFCGRAVEYTNQLAQLRASWVAEMETLEADSLAFRQLEIKLCEVEELLHCHLGKRDLFLSAAQRIYGILLLNDVFLEMITDMHLQVGPALQAGLALLQFYAGPESAQGRPPRFLLAEFNRSTSLLAHPHTMIQQLIGRRETG